MGAHLEPTTQVIYRAEHMHQLGPTRLGRGTQLLTTHEAYAGVVGAAE